MRTVLKFLAIIFTLLTLSTAAHAKEVVKVDVNATVYVNVGSIITRITSGNPSIAVVKQIDPTFKTGFLVEGHGVGTTVVLAWTPDNQIKEFMIVVSPEDVGQALLIEEAIGLPDVHVKKIGEKILLTGSVKNQYERNYTIQIASFYVKGNVSLPLSTGSLGKLDMETNTATSNSSDDIEGSEVETSGVIVDLLKMLHPTQVRLEAQVIDINSDNTKDLGFQYGMGSDSRAGISISPNTFGVGEGVGRDEYSNNPLKWLDRHRTNIVASIRALVSNGKARILSHPSITTMSGEQATIQIGGQIPYTTSNLAGTTVQFKDYGIILQCQPIVDADNKITVAIHAEVSNLSGQSIDGQPIISNRHADAVVNLESGTSMLIGGLMDSSEGKSISKIPLLGDIPIIGEFFKYSYKTRNKRELIIIVTPTVVETTDTAPMTNEMRDNFEQSKHELQDREDVNLNPDRTTYTAFN